MPLTRTPGEQDMQTASLGKSRPAKFSMKLYRTDGRGEFQTGKGSWIILPKVFTRCS